MTDDLLVTIRSLETLMMEENALLATGARPSELAPLASAKLRLVGAMEASCAEQERKSPTWLQQLGHDDQGPLTEAIRSLLRTAALNAASLQRQIDLGQELVAEIASEARRLGGARQTTYRKSGLINRRDDSAPVAINTRL